MNIYIREDRKIEIEMKQHILEALEWFGEIIHEKPTTPANKNLFNVQKDAPELGETKSDFFILS